MNIQVGSSIIKTIKQLSFLALPVFIYVALAAPVSATPGSLSTKAKVRLEPTISISLSSANLLIADLNPVASKQSNIIDITISTNNPTGYTLNATVGNATYNTTDLKHRTVPAQFTHLSTSDNLTSLTDSTWGYSTDEGAHYSGLPLYTDTPKELKNSAVNTTDTVKFSIGAKASLTQPSGSYRNVINLTAVTNHVPVGLAEAYQANGKTKVTKPGTSEEYYTMQDMNSDICEDAELESTLKVMDTRDNKVYWITKLKMNREGTESACWMTQNLGLDLSTATTLTPDNTDIPTPWTPERNTINFTGINIPGWPNNNNRPYSASPGDTYYYTSNSNANDTTYTSLSACTSAGHSEDDCKHYHAGNYYNWSAAIAMNDSSLITTQYQTVPQSICPKGWRLPKGMTEPSTSSDFAKLLYANNITDTIATQTNQNVGYNPSGFNSIRANPLYFSRSGDVSAGFLHYQTDNGFYWSSSVNSATHAYDLYFYSSNLCPQYYFNRDNGFSVRCLAH